RPAGGPDNVRAVATLLRPDTVVCGGYVVGATVGQPWDHVGRYRSHHAGVRIVGHVLQSKDLVRGGLEIHYHWEHRYFAGPVWHDLHLLFRRKNNGGRCASQHELERAGGHRESI